MDGGRDIRATSSRDSEAGAGWGVAQPDTSYRPWIRSLSSPRVWRTRGNARLLADDEVAVIRQRWRQRSSASEARLDRTDLTSVSFVVVGSPGSGAAWQYAVVSGLLSAGQDSDFMLVCGHADVVELGANSYETTLFRPYQDFHQPIYAVPGPLDWEDEIDGFMRVFCGVTPPEHAQRRPAPYSHEWMRTLGTQREPVNQAQLDLWMASRPPADQPGPYWAIDTGPLRIIGIDTGPLGYLDSEQGEWLWRMASGPGPKILLTGLPIYHDNRYSPLPIDGGGTVDDVVREPAHDFVAVISGRPRNYQRYPVRVDDRVIHYIVAGGGGTPQWTHTIPRVSLGGVTEDDFRCYPLRGDSLSMASVMYASRLRARSLYITPDQAAAYLATSLRTPPSRDVLPGTRNAVRRLRWLSSVGVLRRLFLNFVGWDTPPFFRSFLTVNASPTQLVLRCRAVPGAAEYEANPPIEDEVVIPLSR